MRQFSLASWAALRFGQEPVQYMDYTAGDSLTTMSRVGVLLSGGTSEGGALGDRFGDALGFGSALFSAPGVALEGPRAVRLLMEGIIVVAHFVEQEPLVEPV